MIHNPDDRRQKLCKQVAGLLELPKDMTVWGVVRSVPPGTTQAPGTAALQPEPVGAGLQLHELRSAEAGASGAESARLRQMVAEERQRGAP